VGLAAGEAVDQHALGQAELALTTWQGLPWDTDGMTAEAAAAPDPGGLRARLRDRRSAVIATADRYGAHNVRLFGSIARGDHTATSDVDLLVDFDQGVGLFQVARLVAELERLLESHVDVVSAGSLRPWDDVLEEAIPL
jgi:predicted nucleotidyltransferase